MSGIESKRTGFSFWRWQEETCFFGYITCFVWFLLIAATGATMVWLANPFDLLTEKSFQDRALDLAEFLWGPRR